MVQMKSTVTSRFTNTGLIQTLNYFADSLNCPQGKKSLSFSLNSTLLNYGHPCILNTLDTFYGPLNSHINKA